MKEMCYLLLSCFVLQRWDIKPADHLLGKAGPGSNNLLQNAVEEIVNFSDLSLQSRWRICRAMVPLGGKFKQESFMWMWCTLLVRHEINLGIFSIP